MGAAVTGSLTELATVLGFEASSALMAEALTHRSAVPPARRSNERLEFLGDRVLNLAIATWLHHAFPQAPEGDLSLMHTALVRAESCAEVAQAWTLWPHLRHALPAPVAEATRLRVLADAVEALLGALYLERGAPAVQALVEQAWAPLLAKAKLTPRKDPKTALQEWLQAKGSPVPTYTTLGQSGPDHAATFTVEARCAFGAAVGEGPSKAAAAMAAAEMLWKDLTA